MLLIPPPIARVCALAGDPEADLRPAAQEALSFARQSQLMLEHLATSLLRTRQTVELLEQSRLELQAQVDACSALLLGDRGSAAAVRRAAERLLELYFELRQAELGQLAYAPFGPADQFVKVAMNVLDGALPPFHVESRLPAVVTLANSLEDDVRRFERFYGPGPAVDQARAGLQEIQAGLGAALDFARQTERAPLEDSLKLLAAGFQRVHAALRAFDETARGQLKRSKHLVLEELGRALELGDHQLVVDAWHRVEQAFYQLCSGLDSFVGFPYLPLMELEHTLAQRAVRDLGTLMTRAAPRPEQHLQPLELSLTAAVQAVELLYRRRIEELERYRQAPQVEELRELVFRVKTGEAYRDELQHRIGVFRKRLGDFEPNDLIERQLEALELMENELEAGWKALEPCLEEMIAARAAMPEPRTETRTVSCFKCGTANSPERRTCSACQAMLPAVAPTSGPTEYTDIVGGGPAEAPLPRDLARLEELVRAAEAGEGDPEAVAREVDALLARAESLLNQFDQAVVPAAHQDQTVAAYAQFFEDRVQEFVEGLATMREYAGTAGSGTLRRGFEMCRAAGGELLAMKQKLEASR